MMISRQAQPATVHRVVVLVLPGALPLDVGIPAQVFRQKYGAPYEVLLAGEHAGPVPASEPFHYLVEHGVEAFKTAGTIVVPGYSDTDQEPSSVVLEALRAAHNRGVRIASVCTGAFALAAAGLLDDRRAATHWKAADTLAARYPLIRVDRDVLFVDEEQILTSAGVAAGIDLCLHMIRRDHGSHLAAEVARHIVAAPYREGGQAQFIPRPLPEGIGRLFARTRAWALERLETPLTVADMAAHAHVSYRTFTRRFVEDTGLPALQWLLRARVD
ncbi:DJ-1/PfpI family protein [Actinomycetaceae bacterium L2_0104]